ncbi:hypothetical protein DH2020_038934 [Rehmannia glutinosa]|uniref:Uncharacterized protein n=1 Tax=Rehmannia glutinosa TaxID=99300 RepID=A0ABR0UXW3_REHGL
MNEYNNVMKRAYVDILDNFSVFEYSILHQQPSCDHDLLDNNYFQEEYGIDFRNYPSYFNPIEGIKFDNSVKIEGHEFSEFKKLDRRLESSVKTINVLNFGAKGDGKSDDTKVSIKEY